MDALETSKRTRIKRRRKLSEEECSLLLEGILEKCRDLGSVRDLPAFKRANEDYEQNSTAINGYIKQTYGKTPLQFLRGASSARPQGTTRCRAHTAKSSKHFSGSIRPSHPQS